MNITQHCYCHSNLTFLSCCQPYLSRQTLPPTAEALMRSRFTAYVLEDYDYILHTYSKNKHRDLSVEDLQKSAADTQWLSLEVVHHATSQDRAQVEFKAYYQIDQQYYLMHELSDFILEKEEWRYSSGKMLKGTGEYKPQRNSFCVCGSGRKFKKCCGK